MIAFCINFEDIKKQYENLSQISLRSITWKKMLQDFETEEQAIACFFEMVVKKNMSDLLKNMNFFLQNINSYYDHNYKPFMIVKLFSYYIKTGQINIKLLGFESWGQNSENYLKSEVFSCYLKRKQKEFTKEVLIGIITKMAELGLFISNDMQKIFINIAINKVDSDSKLEDCIVKSKQRIYKQYFESYFSKKKDFFEIVNEKSNYQLVFVKINPNIEEIRKLVYEIISNSEIHNFNTVISEYGEKNLDNKLKKYQNEPFSFCAFLIIKDVGVFPIGTISLSSMDSISNTLNMSFFLLTEWQGKSLGEIMLKKVLNHVRNNITEPVNIVGCASIYNIPSQTAMKKAGFISDSFDSISFSRSMMSQHFHIYLLPKDSKVE